MYSARRCVLRARDTKREITTKWLGCKAKDQENLDFGWAVFECDFLCGQPTIEPDAPYESVHNQTEKILMQDYRVRRLPSVTIFSLSQ